MFEVSVARVTYRRIQPLCICWRSCLLSNYLKRQQWVKKKREERREYKVVISAQEMYATK